MLGNLLKKVVQTGPAYARKSFCECEQQAFYLRLRQALPTCNIFPNMPLAALIAPTATDARHQRQQQDRLDGRIVAYAVFDGALELLCVIELTHAGMDEGERSLTLEFLQDAGIKHFSWANNQPPSSVQIQRAMAAYSDIAAPKFEAAVNVPRFEADLPAARSPTPQRHLCTSSLTMDVLEALTPRGAVKATYPHIWERICLFCTEPRHLEQYLSSLSLQDRGGKRHGFPDGVIAELADLQGANARFIPTQTEIRTGWNDVFFNR